MYHNLAPYYDYIFPAGEKQLQFFQEEFERQGVKSVLDLACGTGNYSLQFARWGLDVVGIDYEEEMIKYAKQKAARQNIDNVKFMVGDMRSLPDMPPFDAVICIGNSLVHLLTDEDLSAGLKEMYRLCKAGGLLVIQILNYNYILDQKVTKLPDIRHQEKALLFTRQYQFRDDGLINFITSLTINTGDQQKTLDTGSVKLRPLRPQQLAGFLEQAGFGDLHFYAGFTRKPVDDQSMPLVVKAYKK